ncbi:MAG TPA: PQQ-binding-like beta-propeller repeat protein, partial [Pyrinomonadaceae bacterium]|nr:PQQ-binding-like beta-propeller repeat protein [Pyrinomonadaceae bacterium]
YKLNPADGSLIWRYNPGCSGGGGKTPALYNGRLYVRDSSPDYIFDSQTGGMAGSFISKSVPAFSGNLGFFLNGPKYFGAYGTLEARDVGTNIVQWSFAGDGFLNSSVIVVNGFVYVGSDHGKLYALDAATGHQVWSGTAGTSIPYVDEQNVSQPLTGFAAGEGIIVIPTRTTLVAYEGDHTPTMSWDFHAPAANADGWNNTSVKLYFTPHAHPSGSLAYTPGGPLVFNAEGSNQTQQVNVTDTTHNTTATFTSPVVNIDLTKPVTTETLSDTVHPGVTAWYRGPLQVTLAATDNLSGVRNTFYTLDGAATQTYAGPFSISTDGSHTLAYWSTDVAGNVETQVLDYFSVDSNPPSTEASVQGNSADGWYANPAQVSLSATDGASGVAHTYFTVDGGPTQTYANPFTVTGEGNHVISYWSVDHVDNFENAHSLTIKIDATAPTTQLVVTGTPGTNGWYMSQSVQVGFTAADSLSGVATTYYSVNASAPQPFTGTFTLFASSEHEVHFWSVDKVGNTEAQQTITVKVDNIVPTTQGSVSGSSSNGYFNGPALVSLTAADNFSGVANTYYRIDGGATQNYAQAFSVSGDGAHTVAFWSTDVAGNTGDPNTLNINVDTTAPVTLASLSGTAGGAGWYTTPVQVTLSASDNISGVASISYAIDGGALQNYSAPFTISDSGPHTIVFSSRDQANNSEAQQSLTVKIDASAPATQVAVSGNSGNGWYQNPAQVSLTATDSASGVANSFYTIDGGGTQTYSAPFNVSGDGSHVVRYWSVDAAGNSEAQQSATVQIDTTAPSTQMSASGVTGDNGWYRGPVQVSLAGADNQSGLANTFYSLDAGPTQTYAGAFAISSEAQHQLSFWSVDRLGNAEAHQTVTIKIDQYGPRTQPVVSGPSGGGNYFLGAVQISLTATDNLSGVAATYYRIDGGATQTYSSTFTVSGDGSHTVDYWSTDVAGNNTYSYTSLIKIDTTAPTTTATPSGSLGTNGWYLGPVQVLLNRSDNGSGVQSSYYKVDNGAALAYASPFTVSTAGTHAVNYWSLDVAGNAEVQRLLTLNIDNTAPTVTVSASPATAGHNNNKPLTVTVSGHVADTISGVGPVTYSVLDEYGIAQPSGPVTVQANGNYSFTLSLPATKNPGDNNGHLYTITIRVVDQAGNVSTASDTVKIT